MSATSQRADERTIERRHAAYARLTVTLDGQPAFIQGFALPFAVVRQQANIHHEAEYAWPAVARVVAAGGAFRS